MTAARPTTTATATEGTIRERRTSAAWTSRPVWAQHGRVVDQLAERFPAAAELLADAANDVLAFTGFPKERWKQIWSNNPQERLNKELRRRTHVVGIFPNRDAVVRLVGSVFAEQHDEWAVVRHYMSSESLTKRGSTSSTARTR
jgi:putative transposase